MPVEARWLLADCDASVVEALRAELRLSELAARVLAARGYKHPAIATEFLRPQLTALHDPSLMLGMDGAVGRILQAVRNREPILLYGDYDVDGTTSITILTKALRLLGADVSFHVPDRMTEGYGMRADVVERAAASGVRLIVSVDTGIRAAAVVACANSLGVDVIITDHHLPDAELPCATAVLNPNQPRCPYPFKHLCGAGVAFKLIQALLRGSEMSAARQAALLDSFLKPVAIATVADIVPLTGENRVIVRRGLSGLRDVRNPGLRSLLQVAGFDDGECPSAHQVAFRLAPRINAAGRMANARDVVELFLTDQVDRARELAEQLDLLNRERQKTEAEIVELIAAECEKLLPGELGHALVFSGSGWHPGVLGIVASRMVERYHRPVFVLSDATSDLQSMPGTLAGSGRGIPAFHLLDALDSMAPLFVKHGGHKQAAGVTLPATNLSAFREGFNTFARNCLNDDDLRPQYVVDTHAEFGELSSKCVFQVLDLGPFGFGNPQPLFFAERLEVAGPARVIKEGKHFSVPLRQQNRTMYCTAWNFGAKAHLFQPGQRLDALFHIEDDPYSAKRGYEGWRITLKDIREAR